MFPQEFVELITSGIVRSLIKLGGGGHVNKPRFFFSYRFIDKKERLSQLKSKQEEFQKE